MTRSRLLVLTGLLGLMVAAEPLAVDTALPAAGAMAAGLGTGIAEVQLSLSLFVLGMAVGQLVHGPASDRFGRRPVALAAFALFALASAGCALAPGIEALMGFRLVQGFAAAASHILARAIVRDRLDREAAARVLSHAFLVLAIAPIVAPVIGAELTVAFGWRWVFVLVAAYGVMVAALHWRWLEETNDRRDAAALRPARMLANYLIVARSRVFWGYFACSAAAFSGLFALLVGTPTAIIVFLGRTPGEFGFAFATIMVGNLIGLIAGARLVGRVGLDALLKWGAVGGALSGIAMAGLALLAPASLAAIVAPAFLFMASFALILPQAQAGALSPFRDIAGAASSLLGFLQLAAAALTGALVGGLDDGTQLPMALAVGLAGIAGFAGYALLVRPLRAPAGTAA